jgi:hypothetical protein
MKCLTIAVLLTISVYSFGQAVNDWRFKLAIIVPDTMIVDGKLLEYARAVESDHIKDYYRTVKTWRINSSHGSLGTVLIGFQ